MPCSQAMAVISMDDEAEEWEHSVGDAKGQLAMPQMALVQKRVPQNTPVGKNKQKLRFSKL